MFISATSFASFNNKTSPVVRNQSTGLISLGCVCFARTVPTLWGIKPRKAQGEVGYPFDLSNSYLDAITKCITTDFKDYFHDLKYSDQLGMWCTNNEHLQYCHEHDLTNADRDKIIERFTDRIEHLKFVLNKDTKPALFINYYCPNFVPDDINETYSLYDQLYQSLRERRKDRKFKFLIVDTYGVLDGKKLNPNIEFLSFSNLPQPYVWHLDECRCKPFGLAFEQEFIAKVLNYIDELQG